jgi:endonuclease/exonuclease/phosphatase family metal-dependent hydrolase
MTFNLRVRTILDGHNIWDKRRDLVVERVRAFDADLLGTQEGLDSMETYLRQQLGDYTFRGVGRDDGKQRGEMCGVFFKTARFELLDGGYFWLSKTPEKPGSRGWAEVYPRMVTWVKLRPRAGGAPFYWFNTHFDAYSPWAREQSSKLLRDRIAHIAGAMPCIVTGDFNTGPGSTPYRTLLAPQPTAASSLHDVFAPRIRSPRATKARCISSPAGAADGAWTGFSPVRISRPSMQRSTTPVGPAVTHRITSPSPRRYAAPPPLHRSRRRRGANSRRHEKMRTPYLSAAPWGIAALLTCPQAPLPGSSIKPFTALSASFSAASAVLVVFFGALTIG